MTKLTKLIAIDLDGTLLNEKQQISEKNLEAISFAQSQGSEVVIATGRAQFDVQTLFEHTNFRPWIIGANGATIHQPDGAVFHSVPIDKQVALNSLAWLEKHNFYYEIFSNSAIYTPENGRDLLAIEVDRIKSANPDIDVDQLSDAANKQFSQTGFSFIPTYKELENKDINIYNILVFSFFQDRLLKGREYFKQFEDMSIVSSADHNFELEHKHASKGQALELLANHFQLNLTDTAAVGDSFNDLSMLRIAGKSAAMENAPQAIKEACQQVTLSNTENGVAHFIFSLMK
ncbi:MULTISPECIES: Cof-type HAD-IIB family hydrolase [Virgibacillus]|uniref:Phosphatase YwpJ n=1 Tax=Virgibacillus kapii TaxID=1638645 RepID=A0ABQ2E1B6_9BACI|nr:MULTISPECIES: Cof-type HAD-IIB family hydrolase [Virgibacillus]EQB35283.1 hypothetical protein M948_19480 [Virgibacillus sp. CM-4]MYL42687.1 Cof-type HAD-IIB family hydrolase [Virgibacillus massiliensis]GGJ76049.1 phosphatase YwpJ [Virgibacillus kapii]